jgi:hypothetical protein
MTNATTPEATPEDIEALNSAITEAEAKVASLKAAMANDAPEIMKAATASGDYSTLTARGEEIKVAEQAVTRARAKLDEASRASRWENLAEARKPIEDTIHELLVAAKPTVSVKAVKGVARVDDEGVVTVSLKPELAALDMSGIESAIAATFDGKAFKATNVTSIEINVMGLDTASPVAALRPTANVSLPFRNKGGDGSTGARSGALSYDGMGAKDFLIAQWNGTGAGHDYLTGKRAKSYDTAINGTGNGLSNLAHDTAKMLGITPTEVPASA